MDFASDLTHYTPNSAPPGSNQQSTLQNPEAVSEHIQGELMAGRLAGPLPQDTPGLDCSPIGIIPKSNQPGKWRLIHNLSSPLDHSVNDGIDSAYCSMTYSSVGHAVELLHRHGHGSLLAKLDLKSAYRMVLVHPADHPILGIEWQGSVMVDTCLPFGLRSAPKIFSAMADGLSWAIYRQGVRSFIHYLDDFLFVGAPRIPGLPKCSQNSYRGLYKSGVFRRSSEGSWSRYHSDLPRHCNRLGEVGTPPTKGETYSPSEHELTVAGETSSNQAGTPVNHWPSLPCCYCGPPRSDFHPRSHRGF